VLSVRVALVAVVASLPLAGCSDDADSVPAACSSPEPGSETDVAHEPDFAYPEQLRRWVNADGCPVRGDVVMWRQGACGDVGGVALEYQSAENQIFSGVSGPREQADSLPSDAIDTGYSLQDDHTKLFLAADGSNAYLVFEDGHIEVWPAGLALEGCDL
jgi:hypothetical protein